MKFENVGSQKSGRSIAIDLQMINIHTGRYVGSTQEFETQSDSTARF
jgi:curli biogenesis system outer membrane secretion channel CsgG